MLLSIGPCFFSLWDGPTGDIPNFNCNPNLRKLLINYVQFMYEGEGDCSDDSLRAEYNFLLGQGKVQMLFDQEYLDNEYVESAT
jgi:hypothetical protein